jgi:hypothetical protein
MLVVLLPSQAFAASVTTSYVEKLYFEGYKGSLKEVKTALNSLKPTQCKNVILLAEKSKATVDRYKMAVKNKASKEEIANAKAAIDADKKVLNAAKSSCSKSVRDIKQSINENLKKINLEKTSLVKEIKGNLEGKDNRSKAEIDEYVKKRLNDIDNEFSNILDSITRYRSEHF